MVQIESTQNTSSSQSTIPSNSRNQPPADQKTEDTKGPRSKPSDPDSGIKKMLESYRKARKKKQKQSESECMSNESGREPFGRESSIKRSLRERKKQITEKFMKVTSRKSSDRKTEKAKKAQLQDALRKNHSVRKPTFDITKMTLRVQNINVKELERKQRARRKCEERTRLIFSYITTFLVFISLVVGGSGMMVLNLRFWQYTAIEAALNATKNRWEMDCELLKLTRQSNIHHMVENMSCNQTIDDDPAWSEWTDECVNGYRYRWRKLRKGQIYKSTMKLTDKKPCVKHVPNATIPAKPGNTSTSRTNTTYSSSRRTTVSAHSTSVQTSTSTSAP